MKRLLILALVLMMLMTGTIQALAGTVEKSAAPFTDADIAKLTDGLTTVGDYVAKLTPTACSWAYQGAATGETYLTLFSAANGSQLGETTVGISPVDGVIAGVESGMSESLPEGLSGLEARFIGARWLSADYALPAIRGLMPGAAQADVVSAFYSRSADRPDYAVQDINPSVDETWRIDENTQIGGFSSEGKDGGMDYVYGWCTLDAPDEWREYRVLTYHIADGLVQNIKLTYETDPE